MVRNMQSIGCVFAPEMSKLVFLLSAVAFLAARAVAQHPCVNAAKGAFTGTLLAGGTLDGKTSGPVSGLVVSNAGMTSWYYLMGGATPDTAAIGMFAYTVNSTTIGVSTWDWTGCSNFTLPKSKFGSSVSFAAVGPGQVWSEYGGIVTANGGVLEKWSNAFGEYILMDTDSCTPSAIVGVLCAREPTDAVFNWVGQVVVGPQQVSPPPSFYAVPQQCL